MCVIIIHSYTQNWALILQNAFRYKIFPQKVAIWIQIPDTAFQMYLDTETRYSRVSIDTDNRYFTQIIYMYIWEKGLLFCFYTHYILQYVCTD